VALCAFPSTRAWLVATADRLDCEPRFRDRNGNPLTYSQWYTTLRRSLKAAGMALVDYGTHSFRRGGVTALLNACGDITELQTLGSWAHDSTTAWE
jgi:integrase